MRILLAIIFVLIFCTVFENIAVYAEQLDFFTDSQVYSPNKPLIVYGKALPSEDVIFRFTGPDENVITFTQTTSEKDGKFYKELFVWPDASTTIPYGTYTVEAITTQQNGFAKKLEIKFSPSTEIEKVPISRTVVTTVFAPESAAISQPLKIFTQVTSDGMLVAGNPEKLLGTSHVHLPDGSVANLSTSFKTLHPGLYYAEFTPTQEGTHIFHIVAFSQGTISHGSAATVVLKQDIGGLSKQVVELNSGIKETSTELNKLKLEIAGFGSSLDSASKNIDTSVTSISNSVNDMEIASRQLNSLLFPIVASIAVIVALQIVILARRR